MSGEIKDTFAVRMALAKSGHCIYCRSQNTASDMFKSPASLGWDGSRISRCLDCQRQWRENYMMISVLGLDGDDVTEGEREP
jgi:hypothetical protein